MRCRESSRPLRRKDRGNRCTPRNELNLSASAISDFSLGQRAVTGAMHRIFKYRLYPNRKQRMMRDTHLMLCRELYNAGLPERIECYKTNRKGVTWLEQQSQLPAIKEARPEFKNIHAHTLQAVLIGLKRAFQNFFGRVRKGQNPGFPRFQGAHLCGVPGPWQPGADFQGR